MLRRRHRLDTRSGAPVNEWLAFYLVGCAASILVRLGGGIIAVFLRWITRTNVVMRNLRKLERRDERTLVRRFGEWVTTHVLETALSWISVLFSLWSTIRMLLEMVREMFTSVPEALKTVRFPLRNNPDLPVEAVWAHVVAARSLAGEPPRAADELVRQLDAVERRPRMNYDVALRHLAALRIVEPGIVSDAIDFVSRWQPCRQCEQRHWSEFCDTSA